MKLGENVPNRQLIQHDTLKHQWKGFLFGINPLPRIATLAGVLVDLDLTVYQIDDPEFRTLYNRYIRLGLTVGSGNRFLGFYIPALGNQFLQGLAQQPVEQTMRRVLGHFGNQPSLQQFYRVIISDNTRGHHLLVPLYRQAPDLGFFDYLNHGIKCTR